MDTSSTAVSSASAFVPAPVSVPAKVPILHLLLAVAAGVVVVVLGIGASLYYFVRSGRLPVQWNVAKTQSSLTVTTHVMALEPLLVNLADAGGNSYLRVSLTLRVADSVDQKDGKPKEGKAKEDKSGGESVAAVRDTALDVLGRQTADGLLAADGKERLKAELKAALTGHNSDLNVTDVYFTDFLVQR
jgi:flagellar protein FliL